MNTRKEVMENLLFADEYISQVFPHLNKVELVITGGAAFLLHGYSSKFTLDIDMINKIDQDVMMYLESFSINDGASDVVTLSKSYYERTKPLYIKTKVLSIRLLSNEDLVLAKVGRSNASDIEDILRTGILYDVNLGVMREIAAELEIEDYDNFKHKWQDFNRTVIKTVTGE